MMDLHATDLLFDKNKVYRVSSGASAKLPASAKRAVFVYETGQDALPAAAQTMLKNMMKACKFTEEDVLYISASEHPGITIGEIQQRCSPELVLMFGYIPISRNARPLAKHHSYEFNGMKVVVTDAPEKLEGNKREKNDLWVLLQQILKIQL